MFFVIFQRERNVNEISSEDEGGGFGLPWRRQPQRFVDTTAPSSEVRDQSCKTFLQQMMVA